MDRLSTLLSHFGVVPAPFTVARFAASACMSEPVGHVHLLQAGELLLKPGNQREIRLSNLH
jgi:hypothetical protein